MVVERVHRNQDRGVRVPRSHHRKWQHGRERPRRCDEHIPEVVLSSSQLRPVLNTLVRAKETTKRARSLVHTYKPCRVGGVKQRGNGVREQGAAQDNVIIYLFRLFDALQKSKIKGGRETSSFHLRLVCAVHGAGLQGFFSSINFG